MNNQRSSHPTNEQNPLLLQISRRWHIVEHSRRSEYTLCGQRVTHRGAHARLSLVGERNVCLACLKLFKEENPARDKLS